MRYADFAGEGDPAQGAAMGEHISGAFLCHAVGSGLEGPQGVPELVRAVGSEAFVATVGVGIQKVDLSAVAHRNGYAVQGSAGTYRVSETESWEIAMGIGGLGVLPPRANGAGFVLAAVRNKGLVAYDVTSGPGLKEAGHAAFPASVRPAGALRLGVYPNYPYTVLQNGAPAAKTTDLLLVAGGSAGSGKGPPAGEGAWERGVPLPSEGWGTRMGKMGKAGRLVWFLAALWGSGGAFGQEGPPVLPPVVARYAFFGNEAVEINGSVVIRALPPAGGVPEFGGHIASNGSIVVNGGNQVDGNATPGPGHSITIQGSPGQVTGSTTPAEAALAPEPQGTAAWAAYAAAHHNNAVIPGRYLDGGGNFRIQGNRTYTLPAGLYYFRSFTAAGAGRLNVGGPAVVVVTGAMTVDGSARINSGGDPAALVFVQAGGGAVSLNGTAGVSAHLYAPQSEAVVNGNVTGRGSVWARRVVANGSVEWYRAKDGTPPQLVLVRPGPGSLSGTSRPVVEVSFLDGAGGTGPDPTTLSVLLDGQEIAAALAAGPGGAQGEVPEPLAEGPHTLSASVRDFEGNRGSAEGGFEVDTLPPGIAVEGVQEGGLYGAPVSAAVSVSDAHPDGGATAVSLDGQAYVPGTAIAAEGGHTLVVHAADLLGHTAQVALSFSLDTLPPSIAFQGVSAGGVYGEAVSPGVSATDPHLDPATLAVTLDGAPFVPGTPVSAEGDHLLEVSAADTLGHASQASLGFAIDTQPPLVAIEGVEEGVFYGGPVAPAITATDAHLDAASVQVTLNGQPYVSGTEISEEGAYTLHVTAADLAGHTAEASVAFTLDTQAPAIAITGVEDGSWYRTGVVPAVTVDDAHLDPASVQVTLNGQAYVSGTPVTEEGYYVLQASARDLAGHTAQQAVAFAVDKTPPAIEVSFPADNGITKDNPVTLTGYVVDAHPESLTVNGEAAGNPGQSSFSVPIPLAEGLNTVALYATDRAGNSASLGWHVILKTAPPAMAITLPVPGTVTRDGAVDVSGTVSQDAVEVSVNGQFAAIVDGAFTAGQVPLQEGANTLAAAATDAAGNTATATVQVTRDSRPPVIQVASPRDGAHTSAPSATVEGTIGDASPFSATLNGSPLSVSGGAFSQEVALVPGTNWIRLTAVDSAGNAAEYALSVVRDGGAFTVTSFDPRNGATEVSPMAAIRVDFNREVKENTLTAASFQVSVGGQAVSGALVYHGSTVVFLPSASYGEGAEVTVSLTAGLTDLAGTPLEPATAAFTTLAPGGGPAPLALTLDPVPSLTNQASVSVTGSTSPGAAVTFQGGPAPAAATAGDDGRFAASLPLAAGAVNAFTAVASLGGSSTAPQAFSVVQDSEPPFVTGFQVDGGDLLCDFSEALDPQSLTVESVRLAVGGAGVLVTPSLENAGTRLRITPGTPVGASGAALTLTTGIRDLAGNAMASAFTRTLNGGTAAQAFLEGEVYDDATGLPLPGALAELLGGASGSAWAGGGGAWALPVPPRPVTVRLSAPGYTDAIRQANVSAGTIAMVLDARLAPLSPERRTAGSGGGTLTFAAGQITLSVPAGALPDGTTAAVTVLSPEGLPFPLPPGFAPLAAYRLDLTAEPAAALELGTPVPQSAGPSIPAAFFDPALPAWVGHDPATAGAQAVLSVSAAGTYVLLRPDAPPLAPPPGVVPGQPLSGLAGVPLEASSAVLETVPSTITPSQKAKATLRLTPPAPVPSGLPFQVTFTESLDAREGTGTATRHYTPYTEDLFAYQDAAAPSQMAASFPVSPFPGIDVVTLLSGRIDLAAGPYDATPLGGGIFDPQSGQALEVDGGGGTHAVIPAGGSPAPLPVRIFPLLQSSLLAPIPPGFTFLGGTELNLGGGSLALPAVLGLDLSALAAPLQPGDMVVVVKAETVAGVATYVATDLAGINTATGRLETALAGPPWPQVLAEGRYVFLKAGAPVGFVTGRVLTPSLQGLAGAAVGLVGGGWNAATGGNGPGMGSRGALEGRGDAPDAGRPPAPPASQRLKDRIEGLVKAGKAPEAALHLVDLPGVAAVSGADGSYIVPAPLAAVTVRAVDLLTADTGEAPAAPSEAQPVVQKDVVIVPTPMAVVSTTPAGGASGVPVGSVVAVAFSKQVEPASVTASAFQVSVAAGGQAPAPAAGGAQVILGGKAVAFTPDAPWPPGGTVSVTVSGITDRLGQAAAPVSFAFTTAAPPPVRLDPGAIEARLPDASGRICVEGGPGSVEGAAVVYLLNAGHPEHGTVTITANPDGSFAACIAGAVGDTVEVHVVGTSGGERVYTLSRLVSADHTTTTVGPQGGTFTAPLPDGTSVTLQVPEGAFDGPATLAVHAADPSEAAPVPDGFAAGPPIQVELSQAAQKEIAVVLHAPDGWDLNDPAKQYWLVKTVTWGPEQTKSPMVLDTLRPTPCPGDAAGHCLITQSPPFQGLRESAVLQIYQADVGWGWAQGQLSVQDLADRLVVQADGSAFVCLVELSLFGDLWILPVDPTAPEVHVVFKDAYSGETVTEATRTGAAQPGSLLDFGIVTNVATRPYLTGAAPFQALPFQLKAVPLATSDPRVSLTLLTGSAPDLRVQAPAGTAAPGVKGVAAYAQISVAGCNPSLAPVMPDGSFDATIGHLVPGANTGDLRHFLAVGQPISVSYVPFNGGGSATAVLEALPEQPVTDKLALAIRQGKLYLTARGGFGPGDGAFTLYTAMAGKAAMALTPGARLQSDGGLDLDLSGMGLSPGDVLFYTLEQMDVDPSAAVTVTFDRSLSRKPVAETEANRQGFDENQPTVRLVVLEDPDFAMPLPAGSLVDITLAFAPSASAPREIKVSPRQNLKPGVAYELQLRNLQNDAGIAMPQGVGIAGRFRVYAGSVVGEAAYEEMYDIARRGSVLYEAVGEQGFDILDVSDPTAPQSLVGGPQRLLGKTRGVAIGQNVRVPEGGEDRSRTVVAFVGGGDGGHEGFIEVRYADFAGEGDPAQGAAMGEHISGAFLCHAVGSGLEGPQGVPELVRAVGSEAFVATVGVGIQKVDLSAVAHRNGYAVQGSAGTYRVSETESWEIAMGIGGLGVLPPRANGAGFVLAAVRNKGLVAYDVTSGPGLKEAGHAAFPASVRPAGALRLGVYPNYPYTVLQNGAPAAKTTDLLLVAGGSAGLLVYELAPQGASVAIALKTVVPLPALAGGSPPAPAGVYDVALDARRHIAYLACYNAGVALVDMSDPYRCNGQNPYGLLDEDRNGRDDRLLGFLPTAPGSRAALVVDSETGLVYVGGQGSGSGLRIAGAQEPRMEFLLEDPAHPGQYQVPGYLSAFDGDRPRLGVWLPGGAGGSISATLQLYNRKGLEEARQVVGQDAQGHDLLAPVSTVYRQVALLRQSDKKTDPAYNFYLQRNDTPNDGVTLGMLYDPQSPDPALMVTQQGGSLKADAVLIWSHPTGNWADRLSVTRPVSRPWVELQQWIASPESPFKSSVAMSAAEGGMNVDISDFYFIVGETSWFSARVHFENSPCVGTLVTSLQNPGEGELLGMTSVPVNENTSQVLLKLGLKGLGVSSTANANALIFEVVPAAGARAESGHKSVGSARTSVHIVSIGWQAYDEKHPLSDNARSDGTLMPGGGKRIFADWNTPDEKNDKMNAVKILVTVAPTISNFNLALRSFDVDDPSASDDPSVSHNWHLDDESQAHDNRGWLAAQKGGTTYYEGLFENLAPQMVAITDKNGVANAVFWVSRRPGDNYRVGVVPARDVKKLEAWHAKQPAYASPPDASAEVLLDDGKTPAVEKTQVSELLTVWRRLHVEWDSMAPLPTDANSTERDFIEGTLTEISYDPTKGLTKYILDSAFQTLVSKDGSPDLDATSPGRGRFEKGVLTLNPGRDEIKFDSIIGNGGNYVVASPIRFSIVAKDGEQDILNTLHGRLDHWIGWIGNRVTLSIFNYNPSDQDPTKFGDSLVLSFPSGKSISYAITSKTEYAQKWTICVRDSLAFPYHLVDDDTAKLTSVEAIGWRDAQWPNFLKSYERAYILPLLYGSQPGERTDIVQDRILFRLNITLSQKAQMATDPDIFSLRRNKLVSDNYWGAYVLTCYQPSSIPEKVNDKLPPIGDYDPDSESSLLGVNSEAISFIYIEPAWEGRNRNHISRNYVAAHEVGHQFYLPDYLLPDNTGYDPSQGIMGGQDSPDAKFNDADLAKLRSVSPAGSR